MNHLRNDRGQMVIAVGAPGSEERLRAEYPMLIEGLVARKAKEGISAVAARLAIKRAGIQTMLEIQTLLTLLGYDAEEAARLARSI